MKPLKIEFGIPQHGWMDIAFDHRKMTVSDVPCDSLYGLIKCMRNFIAGSMREVVEWSLEPDYENWIFERQDGFAAIHIVDHKGILISTTTNAEAIIPLIISALEKRYNQSFKKNPVIDEHWSWDFPLIEFNILREKVAEQVAASDR